MEMGINNKIKPNCKKSKTCEECGKCKSKKNNKKYDMKKDTNIDIEKFKAKCEKKLRFLQSFDADHNQLINLVEPIALSINSDMDDELFNRVTEHPKRLLYHVNEIVKSTNILNREEKINLKLAITFHDIGKVVKFKKYNADLKKDHHIFSTIITETAMKYMGFEKEQIEKVCWVIYNHNDKSMTMEECLEAPLIYRLLLDADKLDECDVYGVILKSIVRGTERKIKRNNMINQNDLAEWIKEFSIDSKYDQLLTEESKIYYNNMKEKVFKVLDMLDFQRKDDIFDI